MEFLISSALGHVAIPYYEKVLEMEPVGSTEEEKRVSV